VLIDEALGLGLIILEMQIDLWLYFTVTTPFKLYIKYSQLPGVCSKL
jgi:hypothetical protein